LVISAAAGNTIKVAATLDQETGWEIGTAFRDNRGWKYWHGEGIKIKWQIQQESRT